MPTITFDFRVKQNADGTFDAHVADQDIHIKSVETQGKALDEALIQLSKMWNGIIKTADEKQLIFSTSVVSLRINIEMSPNNNHSLDDFAESEETQTTLSEQPVEPHNPITDYQNGIPEALALMELLRANYGGNIYANDAYQLCQKITDQNGLPLTLQAVTERYPGIIETFDETDEEGTILPVLEFINPGVDDTGNALYIAMKDALNPGDETA